MSSLHAEAGPEPYAPRFPTREAYLAAWHTWRAIRRDGWLTHDEQAAQWAVTEAAILRRPRAGQHPAT